VVEGGVRRSARERERERETRLRALVERQQITSPCRETTGYEPLHAAHTVVAGRHGAVFRLPEVGGGDRMSST
jgi:hypothetical protein